MQLVVVIAVRKAVRAATITFTATSTIRFFIRYLPSRLVAVRVILVTAFALTGVDHDTKVPGTSVSTAYAYIHPTLRHRL